MNTNDNGAVGESERLHEHEASKGGTISTRGEFLIVAAGKEIDLSSSKQLLTDVKRRIDEGQTRVIFDLTLLEFIDSTGLSVMVDLQDAATRLGGKVVFAAPGVRVTRILRVTRLDRYIDQFETVADAEAAFTIVPAGAPSETL